MLYTEVKILNKICLICGENLSYYKYSTKEKISKIILELIEKEGVNIFYSTRGSNFDIVCEECVRELKKTHEDLKLCFIFPYMYRFLKTKMEYYQRIYDEVFEFDAGPNTKNDFSTTYRNRMYVWLADISDYMVTYTQRKTGSSVCTMIEYAKNKNVELKFPLKNFSRGQVY